MHYELYFDSLFLLNFGMNLLLLILVDHSTCHTATWYRLTAGSGDRSGMLSAPFFMEGNGASKAFPVSSAGDGTHAMGGFSHTEYEGILAVISENSAFILF